MSTPDPERVLLDRAKAGDLAARDEILRDVLPRLRVFVRAHADQRLKRRESNSDLVQTVCREVLEHLEEYEWQGEGSFRYWLFTLALNKLRNKREFHFAAKRAVDREEAARDSERRAAELAKAYLTLTSPSQHAVAQELAQRVELALDRLPEHYREVVLLARVVGLPHRAIGERLGKSEPAVRQLLVRALAELALQIERAGQEPS